MKLTERDLCLQQVTFWQGDWLVEWLKWPVLQTHGAKLGCEQRLGGRDWEDIQMSGRCKGPGVETRQAYTEAVWLELM